MTPSHPYLDGLRLQSAHCSALGGGSEALGTDFLNGGQHSMNFNLLTSVVPRWLSQALRHAKPSTAGRKRRGGLNFMAKNDTGGWYHAEHVVDWLVEEISTDGRLASPNPQRITWAVLRSACMADEHNIDAFNARSARERRQKPKLRFQIACAAPNYYHFGDPHGSPVLWPSQYACSTRHCRAFATAR